MAVYEFDNFFPKKINQDLKNIHNILLEKYKRRFPKIQYQDLLLPTQSFSGSISTDPTSSTVDDLYGEDVPHELSSGFQQPHSNVLIDATMGKRYAVAVAINAKVEFETPIKDLKKYGRDVEAKFPFIFLNWQLKQVGLIRLIPGAVFIWQDSMYEVKEIQPRGRWADTDYFVYSAVSASVVQLGT